MKESLTKLMTKCNCVISLGEANGRDPKSILQNLVQDYVSQVSTQYGGIVHDRDFRDDGSHKTVHIHLVFTLSKRTRKSTIINRLASYAEVNNFAVSLDSYTSFEGSFQYLIHKNDPNKYQYPIEDVVTNLEEGEVDLVMDTKAASLDLNTLKARCLCSDDLVDIIEFVGLSTYQHYRATIMDIFNWAQHVRMMRGK